jgi:cyclohexa-1,5-dienecarbonyl-CoA hydratase
MTSILFDKSDGVARITLNKPSLNVIDLGMMDEINTALASLKEDHKTHVIVLAAEGRVFSAGVDVADHMPDRVESMMNKFHAIFRTLWSLDQPVVAAVQGAALGGGCELAIACDFIVASESAKFAQPEIKLGVLAPIGSLLLPQVIGRIRANELLLTGDSIDAREAKQMGLVNVVSPEGSFRAAVDGFVARLTTLSGATLRHAKRAIRLGGNGLDEIERYYLQELMQSEDALEGLAAFSEKRRPRWKDK